jgi:hypothetical protein
MSAATATIQGEELTRLEILRAFKKHFAGDGEVNRSPFGDDLIIRYHTDVAALDVPEIHHEVRQAIEEALHSLRHGSDSPVVILAGEAGMGKSHLLNSFRSGNRAEELGYVFVCNSNHWKADEFQECLLDWILEALIRPSPNEPHLLLDKIEEVAFQALGQILARPGQLRKFRGKENAGLARRLWTRLTGNWYGPFQHARERRDARIFRRLDFSRFAGYVCDRFLHESANPFHRYVMRVLLRYLFPEDREKVLHWLRRKNVPAAFLLRLGAEDAIDRSYKVIDTIKILISLFSQEVARGLSPSGEGGRSRVFFFAFDQIEGRKELFDREEDWFKFFAQLSELYNTLPNVFILFTMTQELRNKLYPKMEIQFRHRIRRDQKFILREIPNEEILSVYRRRIDNWLGEALADIRKQFDDLRYRYLPFDQETVLNFCRFKTLRESLQTLDERFRKYLTDDVTDQDPRFEFLVFRNELRQAEEDASPFHYTQDHLDTVTQLLNLGGGFFAQAYGLTWGGLGTCTTEGGTSGLRLEFRTADRPDLWVRVFLVRLPYKFNDKLDGCFELLHGLQRDRYSLWLLRPERVDQSWESRRPGQVFGRTLPMSTETGLQAMLRLLRKRDQFEAERWATGEQVLLEEFKLTYLGELFQSVAEAVESLKKPAARPADA